MVVTTAADVLVAIAAASGIQVCFANPGTSEMHVAGALERGASIKPVLCLHENVATGAADGYARITGTPAMTLLHLGPGLANGLANLHNARRAGSPLLNVVGDMTSWLKPADPLLESDIVGMAHGVSKAWENNTLYSILFQQCAPPQRVVVASTPKRLADDVHACIDATTSPDTVAGSRIATLVVPHDLSWAPCQGAAVAEHQKPPRSPLQVPLPVCEFLDNCADAIARSATTCMMLLGGAALHGPALAAAGRIADATGAVLVAENAFARADRGAGRPGLQVRCCQTHKQHTRNHPTKETTTYRPTAAALLSRHCRSHTAPCHCARGCGHPPTSSHVWLQASKRDIVMPSSTTSTHREGPQSLVSLPDKALWELDVPDVSPAAALEHIAALVGPSLPTEPPSTLPPPMPANGAPLPAHTHPTDQRKAGPLTAHAMCAVLVSRQPADAIVVDESITSGTAYWDLSHSAAPFTHLTLTGGAIGCGPPLALGAALAAPTRRVINLQADGSAAYTLQALWSQARERARVCTIVCVNNAYHILRVEQQKQGVVGCHGALTDLSQPPIDWVALAAGFGVPGVAVDTVDTFDKALVRGLSVDGPFLVAALLS